jgi:hypothetical protein
VSRATGRRGDVALAFLVFTGLLLAHVWFANELPRFRQPNTWSRLYLALAIAEDGRFAIDAQVARHGRVEDLAIRDGHWYSDKAPGVAFLIAPLAFALRPVLPPLADDPTALPIALRLLGVSLPVVLFWLATAALWKELAGSARRGLAVIVVGALGTPFFVYATTLFPHALAGLLAFAGFALVRSASRLGERERGGVRLRVAAAGLAIGAAFASDYVVLLAVPVLALYAVLCRPDGRAERALALAVGALAPALLLGVYHHVCFGSPFSIGSHHLADPAYRDAYARGWLGVQWPDPRALLELTLLPRRGLFFYAPVLLLAPLGWARAWRRPAERPETIAAIATVAAILLFSITTVDWSGGWSFGPRYLVPAIPFLLTGVAAAIRDAGPASPVSIAFRALACVGLVTTALGAASFPFFPREFESPLGQLALPLLLEGHRMPSLVADGLLPFATLVAGACAFVVLAPWRGARLGASVGALALAGVVLLAMVLTAPPATGDLHRAALAMVFQAIGR